MSYNAPTASWSGTAAGPCADRASPGERRLSRRLLCAVVAAGLLGVLALTAPVGAAEKASPSLQRADIAVTLLPDGTARTQATYQLSAVGDAPVSHRVLPRSDSELTDLALSGAGSVQPSDATTYLVSVSDTRYTLVATSRSADPAAGDVPIPVPDIPTAADAAVQIQVTLPDGQQLVGDSLPAFTAGTENGRSVLSHSGPAVPSAVVAPYGTGTAFTLGDTLTVVGLLALAIICLLWFRAARRGHRRPLHPPPSAAPSDHRPPAAATTSSRRQS